jgi:putative NIF3 family GTP cyclohydrolase 1 type 2
MPQVAAELGAEAIIIGALDEYIVINALELGMPVIETLHSVSEIPALKRQAEVLAEKLAELKVVYIPSGAVPYSSQ